MLLVVYMSEESLNGHGGVPYHQCNTHTDRVEGSPCLSGDTRPEYYLSDNLHLTYPFHRSAHFSRGMALPVQLSQPYAVVRGGTVCEG